MASRRVRLPGADEIFRPTAPKPPGKATAPAAPATAPAAPATAPAAAPVPAQTVLPAQTALPVPAPATVPVAARRPTGRQRHDSKITVYVSAGELLDLERLRLTLRAEHALSVDRGRIVREAVAAILADFEARGERSTLVRRLRDGEG
ncbi:hypothetical protein [Actinomadura rudentiformis]|uniref:Cobyrinic acid a,c-diamide synthase n=1 Tax=Actinomadura rudentiformis TaxID=359158 RepID=A0A6H9YPD5_9ACTN|nr:hypothetical protein [Actinomadura rudentiformis]KAB2342676.1 hypothetical protein F8566_37155 [Actinomadura rudentiformis]